MLLYGVIKKYGENEQANLYYDFDSWHRDTFSPATEVIYQLFFEVGGKTYAERKANAEQLAIDYSNNTHSGLSWGEVAEISNYFYKIGKRYGLLREFKENGIC